MRKDLRKVKKSGVVYQPAVTDGRAIFLDSQLLPRQSLTPINPALHLDLFPLRG
ncbi:MAG TPA: hypothetical protein VIH42_00395 [Thermoguttaceae bacterium]